MDVVRVTAALNNIPAMRDTKEARDLVEKIIMLYRNLRGPDVTKRQVNLENANFQKFIWRHDIGREILLNGGWNIDRQANELRYLAGDQEAVFMLELLVEFRDVKPRVHEWTPHNKVVDNSKSQKEAQVKAEGLKEAKKEYEEALRDKKEREEIARAIKAEHRNDQRRRWNARNQSMTP